MIDFSGHTAKEIERAMLSRVPPDIDTREGSMVQTAVGPVAWYLEGLYMLLGQIQENAYAKTAVGEALDLTAQERGLSRLPATEAVRKGTFNVPIAPGSRFKTINGANSVIFVSGKQASDAGEGYVYRMTCEAAGAVGNSYAGKLLPVTAVSGLTTAVLGEIISPGTEEETDDALRARFFETFNVAAFGGNIQSYRNEILAVPGVGAVQVYPVWKGGGTVLCSILGDDLKPALPAVVENVQRLICPPEDGDLGPSANGYGTAPIGAAVTITTATPLTLDISCSVEFISGVQDGGDMYLEEIRDKIQEYLDTVRRTWGNPPKGHVIEYPVTVYVSRILFAILTIPEVVNASGIQVNGSGDDLRLVETAGLQQIPVLGEVVIHEG